MAPRPHDKTANEPLTVALDLGKHTQIKIVVFYSNLTLSSLKNRPLVPSPFFCRGGEAAVTVTAVAFSGRQ